MENIIEDLLTLSKLENDDSEVEFEDCDVIDFVKNICKEYKQIAAKKQTIVNFSSAVQSHVKQISPNLFYHGLANILDNAVKYYPENSVVDVSIEPVVTPNKTAVTLSEACTEHFDSDLLNGAIKCRHYDSD